MWLGRRPHALCLLAVICSRHFPSPSHFTLVYVFSFSPHLCSLAPPPADSFTRFFLICATNTSCCLSNSLVKLKDSFSPLIPVAERERKKDEEHLLGWRPVSIPQLLISDWCKLSWEATDVHTKEHICITSGWPMFNISKLSCISPLDLLLFLLPLTHAGVFGVFSDGCRARWN